MTKRAGGQLPVTTLLVGYAAATAGGAGNLTSDAAVRSTEVVAFQLCRDAGKLPSGSRGLTRHRDSQPGGPPGTAWLVHVATASPAASEDSPAGCPSLGRGILVISGSTRATSAMMPITVYPSV